MESFSRSVPVSYCDVPDLPVFVSIDTAEWHEIIGAPDHLRDLARRAGSHQLPVTWPNRQGRLWTLSVYCTDAQLARVERTCPRHNPLPSSLPISPVAAAV